VAPDDPRVIRAVEEYLAALEAGPRPDRQQFLARQPEIAEALAGCLDGLEFLHAAAPQLSQPWRGRLAAPVPGSQPEGPLGDFRIIREVGRGGMGVVYEAVQLSLGRRVALKVLPFAAALDPRQLQRFQHEAQAAARLHHTHIVPVYAVGCERGVHYYAMQFIDGQTLAQVIRELRRRAGLEADSPAGELASGRWAAPRCGPAPSQHAAGGAPAHPSPPGAARTVAQAAGGLSAEPSIRCPGFFRAVARLGVQAAEALEHAHQQGVVHRDIKPANLLVDGHGHLWVADFGLARFHSEAGLTLSGDLLGTLRYMSPEQALARRGLVDHRTDVYSLGLTLYELLTLEPACRGADRHEVLRRLEREEPCPPRGLNRAVPKDLETIVLKALAREPAGRYATAQELAEDLRRFLEDRPIRARRPTLLRRATQWSRRHRAAVGAAALLLLLAVVGLVVNNVLIGQERARAEEQAQQAAANYRMARDAVRRLLEHAGDSAVDQMLAEAGQNLPADVPPAEPLRRELLERALKFYEEFLEEHGTDPAVRRERVRAYGRVGDIRLLLGQHALAEQAYRQALKLDPDNAEVQDRLARLLATCPAPRLRDARQAVDLAKKAVARAPRNGAFWNTLGIAQYRAQEWRAAVASLEKSMQLRKGGDASDWFFLAMAHWRSGAKDKAREWYDRAVRWVEKNRPKDEELGRFRAEAAALLGLPGPPPRDGAPGR
jgi:serine/threonine protein kinase